jgi:predicted transcriptional regulator
MGSPLAPVLADILMIQLEKKLMKKLQGAGVMWYKRYVDDTFSIVDKDANIENIKEILNSYHPDI